MKNLTASRKTTLFLRITAIVLVIPMLLICLSSCASFSKKDKETAEKYAIQRAEAYYKANFKGKTLSGVKFSDCSTSIKNSVYKNGKYIVTVSLSTKVSSGGYSLTLHMTDIEYTIAVRNGNASVKGTKYITD